MLYLTNFFFFFTIAKKGYAKLFSTTENVFGSLYQNHDYCKHKNGKPYTETASSYGYRNWVMAWAFEKCNLIISTIWIVYIKRISHIA